MHEQFNSFIFYRHNSYILLSIDSWFGITKLCITKHLVCRLHGEVFRGKLVRICSCLAFICLRGHKILHQKDGQQRNCCTKIATCLCPNLDAGTLLTMLIRSSYYIVSSKECFIAAFSIELTSKKVYL